MASGTMKPFSLDNIYPYTQVTKELLQIYLQDISKSIRFYKLQFLVEDPPKFSVSKRKLEVILKLNCYIS